MQIWINWLVFFLCRQQDEGLFPCTHKEYTSLRLFHLTYSFCNTKATPNYLQNLSIKDANDYFKNIPTLCVRIWKNGNGPFLVRAPPKYLMLQVHYWVRHGFFSKIVLLYEEPFLCYSPTNVRNFEFHSNNVRQHDKIKISQH